MIRKPPRIEVMEESIGVGRFLNLSLLDSSPRKDGRKGGRNRNPRKVGRSERRESLCLLPGEAGGSCKVLVFSLLSMLEKLK